MRFEVTIELLEEMACCIVDNDLNRDEACDYVRSCVMEDVEDVDDIPLLDLRALHCFTCQQN